MPGLSPGLVSATGHTPFPKSEVASSRSVRSNFPTEGGRGHKFIFLMDQKKPHALITLLSSYFITVKGVRDLGSDDLALPLTV